MDIWEANSISTAYTPHPCDDLTQERCEGDACGGSADRYGSECDPDGCDFNSYRMGDTSFYGPGMTVDTGSVFTVVTQFITDDGTDTGTLSEIRRIYVQNGAVIANSASTIDGITGDSITSDFCDAQKSVFGDTTSFQNHGGLAHMGDAMDAGMVLVMSLWDDHAVNMLWLDSTYPTDCTAVGCARGTCATSSGVPADVESQSPGASVTYSNIKFGPLDSTYSATGGSTGGGSGATTTTTAGGSAGGAACSGSWGQCGGNGWTGATCCQSGWSCVFNNAWYSQCLQQ